MRYSSAPLFATMGMIALAGCGTYPEGEEGNIGAASPSALQSRPRGVVPWRDNTAPRNTAAPAGAHLTYYGGRVNAATKAIVVLWGTGSYESHIPATTTPSMLSFLNQTLSNGSLTTWLNSEYNTVSPTGTKTNQNIGAGSATQVITITPSVTTATITDAQIQSEISAQIAAGNLPAKTYDAQGNATSYYAVFFPHGKTINQGGSNSCQSGGFCAYHGTVGSGSTEYYYGVHPDMQAGSGCDVGCGSAATSFGNYTSVASHELVEMITDPEVGLATTYAPPLAWYDQTNGEIGDICNAQQGTYTGCDGQAYTIQLEFSNAQANCIGFPAPTCGPDFNIAAAPATLSIVPGASGSSAISTTALGGAGTVALAVTGAPAGVTAALSPTSVAAGGSSTLNVTVATTAAAGNYPLTVTGTEGTKVHSTTVSLSVAAANDFSVAITAPTSKTATAGATAVTVTYPITTALVRGTAQTVTLAVSGLSGGVTGAFSPASVTAGGSSTLTLTVPANAASSTSNFTVTGTSPSASHTAAGSLVVTGNAPQNLLQNPGFESGAVSWTATSGVISNSATNAHAGSWKAFLNGYGATHTDTLYQQVTIPATATSATLTFWLSITTAETSTTTAFDKLAVQIRNSSGTILSTLATYSNLNKGAYVQKSFNVTAYKGQTIRVFFNGTEDSSLKTSFFVDDTALTVQ